MTSVYYRNQLGRRATMTSMTVPTAAEADACQT